METQLLPEHICKSCGNKFAGFYCNVCGEKVIEAKDRKLKTYLSSIMIATTVVDNKLVKSLWPTISNPGFLSREYVDGRRVNYMRPLQMFFILNLVYFFAPVLQMFNSSFNSQTRILAHAKLAQGIVMNKIREEGMSLNGFELIYNEKTVNLAKLLVVIFIVLASLPLSLIFSKRNRFFTDHLALAVELTSFNLAINAIALTILFWIINKTLLITHSAGGSWLNEATITVIFISTNLYFIFRAARTFYNQTGKNRILKASLGIVGLFLALELYRIILFFITIWSI